MYPSFHQMNLLRENLVKAYREEEWFRKQKTREKWLKEGDNNTTFFHASAKANRAKNRLDKLVNVIGELKDLKPPWERLLLLISKTCLSLPIHTLFKSCSKDFKPKSLPT